MQTEDLELDLELDLGFRISIENPWFGLSLSFISPPFPH